MSAMLIPRVKPGHSHFVFQLLEMQQQLAVAVSTDRKKDTMIEQLDRVSACL